MEKAIITLEELKKVRGIGEKTIQEIREYLISKGQIKKRSVEEVKFPKKKYDVIYADPPWQFKTWSNKGKGRSAEQHYECQDLGWIKSLPVERIAKENCVLFLWVTFPFLEKGLEVIKSWGFTYKGLGFVWVKRNKSGKGWFWGLGYWTRQNSEVCLIATRGNPKRVARDVHSVIDGIIEEHSKKPDEARVRISRLMGDGDIDKIELFARQRTEGWDAWGNEV